MESTAPAKDLQKRRAGLASAGVRWGPPRVIRLDGLDPDARAFISELVAVARKYARPAEVAER